MLRKSSKARAQRPEQCIGRQLFMGWGSLHDPHISDVKRVEPWDWRPIVAEIGTKRHRKCRNECLLLGSSGNCCIQSLFRPLYRMARRQLSLTPMKQVFRELKRRGLSPQDFNALEIFGGSGDFHLKDYASLVSALEVWEI